MKKKDILLLLINVFALTIFSLSIHKLGIESIITWVSLLMLFTIAIFTAQVIKIIEKESLLIKKNLFFFIIWFIISIITFIFSIALNKPIEFLTTFSLISCGCSLGAIIGTNVRKKRLHTKNKS